jgi:rubrerythrin
MREGEESGYEHIRSKKTLKEIIEVASSFEAAAHAFYHALAPTVSEDLHWLVEELAEEELCHYDLLTQLASHQDIEQQLQYLVVDAPPDNGHFFDLIQQPDLGRQPDDLQVLQYALGREHTAMMHYRALAERAPPGVVRDLFALLGNEEARHKAKLEKLYHEILYSRGV